MFPSTSDADEPSKDDEIYDLVVIGGGVVGLSILREATIHGGLKCALVEREEHLLEWASGSNSGIVCTGVDASGLERALIRDSISRIRTFMSSMNIPMRPCGSLVCNWPWDGNSSDDSTALTHVLAESHDAGDNDASLLLPAQVLDMEPNLNRSCLGAVHIPGEIVIDPWLFSIAHAVLAVEHGANIYTNFAADMKASFFDENERIWTIVNGAIADPTRTTAPRSIRARAVVNAAGAWADEVQGMIQNHDSPPWKAQPRRGQYVVLNASPSNTIKHPIQPIPTQRTKGIFVFSSIYDQIVIGPTAVDQDSRTNREPDPETLTKLLEIGQRILPQLDVSNVIAEYVGIRPGTNQRDYIIQANAAKQYIVCAGIRSTGLTASLGIGRHVLHLLQSTNILSRRHDEPEDSHAPPPTMTPLPCLRDLVKKFRQRADGCVTIHNHVYKVTHPLTIAGWNAMEI